MDDTALATFTSITGTTPDRAAQYLKLTEGDVQQAIEFFYANDGAELETPASSAPSQTSQAPPVQPSLTRPQGRTQGYEDEDGVVHIDSDLDSEIDTDPPSQTSRRATAAAARSTSNAHTPSTSTSPPHQASREIDEDEALARRLQEEFYGATRSAHRLDENGIRAPMARTTETLIGPESFDSNDPEDMHAAVLEQLRARHRPRPRGMS